MSVPFFHLKNGINIYITLNMKTKNNVYFRHFGIRCISNCMPSKRTKSWTLLFKIFWGGYPETPKQVRACGVRESRFRRSNPPPPPPNQDWKSGWPPQSFLLDPFDFFLSLMLIKKKDQRTFLNDSAFYLSCVYIIFTQCFVKGFKNTRIYISPSNFGVYMAS